MDRLFRIDFYPQDWIVDTARMTLEERGLFIQIVSLIYANRGPIENDAAWIAGVSGCSSRMARSIIKTLEANGFIQFQGSKITQKRAESELKSKRKYLEKDANTPRNSDEIDGELFENNDLTSQPYGSPPTPTPNPIAIENNKHRNTVGEKRETGKSQQADRPGDFGVSNSLNLDGVRSDGVLPKTYHVALHLDGKAVQRARDNAPGMDMAELLRIYDEGVNSGRREIPLNASAAFPEWCKAYYDGIKKNKLKRGIG